MSTIDTLKRVLSQVRAGEKPAEADLLVLEQAVHRVEARKAAARGPGRPKGSKNRDLSHNSEGEQKRIERVMEFLKLVEGGMKKGDAGIKVFNGSTTLRRDRKKYERLARYFLEEDAVFESTARKRRRFHRPSASEDFGSP